MPISRFVSPWLEVFVRFLRLGCTSFGGPVAHLGYFRREFVERARWLDDPTFTEIVALCSVLPGPTSSQVGIMIGARKAGPVGALLAWLAFTTPSALALAAFGITLRSAAQGGLGFPATPAATGMLEGLGAAAAAVVFLAVTQLARNVLVTRAAQVIGALCLLFALVVDRYAPGFIWAVLAVGGLAGALAGASGSARFPAHAPPLALSRRTAVLAAAAFALLLFGLPIVAPPNSYLDLFATFFRAGSLVFGGGHVVLPFLATLIDDGRVSSATFFAGYGAAQAVPGPLFTFSAFLGGVDARLGGPAAALVAVAGIFAPSFLLLAAVVPLWTALRQLPHAAATLAGLNAAVVGLLAAVFVDPIATSLAHRPLGIAVALAAFALLQFARWPAWAVVVASAAAGATLRTVLHAPA